jgi:hypothetical protein
MSRQSPNAGIGGRTQQAGSPTTFVQTLVDVKNAANVVPEQFEAKGHDDRADLARFIREVYALPASDHQRAAQGRRRPH